jgi:hypothetical protein
MTEERTPFDLYWIEGDPPVNHGPIRCLAPNEASAKRQIDEIAVATGGRRVTGQRAEAVPAERTSRHD